MALEAYKNKRRFNKTPEPAGGTPADDRLHFVVQKHAATNLHYDFRLEMKGVLKSWAVPKGPSMDPGIKRTAIMVEDHPYDYKDFEGNIPEGQYGGGSVIIWDEGTFEPVEKKKSKQEKEGSLLQQLYKGDVEFILKGKKLKGKFRITKMPQRGENNWLLIKVKDKFAGKTDILGQERSVISHLTVEEMAENRTARIWNSNRSEQPQQAQHLSATEITRLIKQGNKTKMPQGIKPMKCELIHEPFDHEDWIYELKLDGYRIIAAADGKKVILTTTEVQNYTKKYQVIVEALSSLNNKVVLDGEMVVLNEDGIPDFSKLQNYKGTGNLVYYVFDLLWIDGYDVTKLDLLQRKSLLRSILPGDPSVRFVDHIEEQGKAFFELVQEKELEGWVAKRKDSGYYPGTDSKSWLKLPNQAIKEYVIVGWTESSAGNLYARLMYGEYRDGKLYYVHHTGSRPSKQVERTVYNTLKEIEVKKKPVVNDVKEETPIHWVKPVKVARLRFKSLKETLSGKPRHPVVFMGFRDDKFAEHVTAEDAVELDEVLEESNNDADVPSQKPVSKTSKAFSEVEVWKRLHPGEAVISQQTFDVEGKAFQLINTEKDYWAGITKGQVLLYYASIAEYILPYLKDRPLGLNVVKEWAGGENEFVRNSEGLYPSWVTIFKTNRRIKKKDKVGDIDWVICNDIATLLYLVNLGALDLHPWAARKQKAGYPDYLVIDLDPPDRDKQEKNSKVRETDRKNLIKTALACKKVFDKYGLITFIKTSGKYGLHIFIPCSGISYDISRSIVEALALEIHKAVPMITTLSASTEHRNGKIYIDPSQNDYSDRVAVAYCIRAHKQPTVSVPLQWEEINETLDVRKFRFDTVLKRLEETGDPFKDLLNGSIQKKNGKLVKTLI
jgi:bifunctional non-homologous end joining protein LigD